jgi:hypothetical protein
MQGGHTTEGRPEGPGEIVESLRRLLPSWDRLYPEIRQGLIAAERLHAAHVADQTVPRFILIAPYILVLERELIQFYKHKFPRWLRRSRPQEEPDAIPTEDEDLREMVRGSERISLGHFVNWMSRLDRASGDELLAELRSFTEVLDPAGLLFGKAALRVLSAEILPCRKSCVHLSRIETWPDTKRLDRIRELVLLDFPGPGKGFLPSFIEGESAVLEKLGLER